MAWYDNAVFYHIYPLGLCGCAHENDGQPVPGAFKKLDAWAEHAAKLGCTAIYIGPLFESGSHGYDTIDYRLVDRRLGTNEDFKQFVTACHERGQTVIVDGVEQQNPYVRRGTDGTIIEVHCRAMAFRYNENGQPMVSDRTTIFDTATYALADMVGKAKRAKDAFKLLPSAVPAPTPPEEWACYRVDDAVNLWMKITHEEVINFLGQVLNRKKKALEFAQTFAQRNALKHLFGIAVVPGQGSGQNCNPISQWDVPVVCWAPSDGGLIRFDTSRYAASTKVIEALSAGKPVALPEATEPLVISRGTDEVHGSDMDQEADPLENPDRYENSSAGAAMFPPSASEEEPAAAMPDTEQPQEEPAPDWTVAELGAWKNLQVAREEFPTEYVDALADCGLTDKEVNPGNAAEINLAISRMLDAQ